MEAASNHNTESSETPKEKVFSVTKTKLEEIIKERSEIRKYEMIEKGFELAPPIIDYFKTKLEKHDVPLAKRTIVLLVLLFVVIIGSTTTLVILGKLDSSAYTFVIGTVVGFLIAMAKVFFNGGE
jgi:hypothetical protein